MRYFYVKILTACSLLFLSMAHAENSKPHDITIEIKLKCPTSEEFEKFMKSVPPAGSYSSTWNEWKSSFINNMNQLIDLVESEKISNSFWSVKTDE
jgi:hypothetical protein